MKKHKELFFTSLLLSRNSDEVCVSIETYPDIIVPQAPRSGVIAGGSEDDGRRRRRRERSGWPFALRGMRGEGIIFDGASRSIR